MSQQFELSKSVTLEISNIADLRFVEFVNGFSKAGISTLMRKINFRRDRNFSFFDYAIERDMTIIEGEDRYSDEPTYLLLDEKNQVGIKVNSKTKWNEVNFFGLNANVQKVITEFKTLFEETGAMIRWVYDTHGSYTNMPLNVRPLVKSAYPFIDGDVEQYIDDYIDSDASIIILLGPPGTGKTSLIKHMISRSKCSAHVSYDMNVMQGESLFTEFMTSDSMFLILEDADHFLVSRKEGNTMMHRFLNVGDGLISTKGKKIIFSCNLENPDDIDTALTREGRCFDVLTTRKLNLTEAKIVHEELKIGFPLPNKQEFTLAEITNRSRTHKQELRRVGFY